MVKRFLDPRGRAGRQAGADLSRASASSHIPEPESGIEKAASAKASERKVQAADVSVQRGLDSATCRQTGDAFLQSLVLHLCQAWNADVAFVGELVGGPTAAVRTVAVASAGALVDNFDYEVNIPRQSRGL